MTRLLLGARAAEKPVHSMTGWKWVFAGIETGGFRRHKPISIECKRDCNQASWRVQRDRRGEIRALEELWEENRRVSADFIFFSGFRQHQLRSNGCGGSEPSLAAVLWFRVAIDLARNLGIEKPSRADSVPGDERCYREDRSGRESGLRHT